jgi:chromosome partitioning protein
VNTKVVAVVNNKGGVGKTTLTANIGAGVANSGGRVLMIDLDPQASLTKSFFTVEESQAFLANVQSISKWFKSPDKGRAQCLADLIISPPRFNQLLKNGGWLELIPSDAQLIDAEVLIPKAVDATGNVQSSKYLPLHRRLAEDLADPAFEKYDVILVDCAPSFNLPTKMAIIASDMLIIPARPDFLSAEAVQELGRALMKLRAEFNEHLRSARGHARSIPPMLMPPAAVLFTMVQLLQGRPIEVHRQFINEVIASGVPMFGTMVRDRSSAFAASGRYGVPTIMANGVPAEVRADLQDVVEELPKWFARFNRDRFSEAGGSGAQRGGQTVGQAH